jgi:tetratricopeptide (TPR) repeat protein
MVHWSGEYLFILLFFVIFDAHCISQTISECKKQRHNLNTLLESGQVLIEQRSFDHAIECLELAAVKVHKQSNWKSFTSFQTFFLLALASLESGNLDKAEDAISTMESHGLKLNNDCWMIKCGVYDRRHQFLTAGGCYLDAAKAGVDVAHGFAGSAFSRAGNLSASAAAYRQATDKHPTDSTLLLNYGAVLRRLRRFTEAETFYSRATALRPTQVGAHIGLGKTLFDNGHFNSSAAAFQTAWTLCAAAPTPAARDPAAAGCTPAQGCEARLGWARSLQRQGRNDSAVLQYEAALSGPCRALDAARDDSGRRLLAHVHGSLAGVPQPPAVR